MADLLDLSARIIDSGHADQPVNRVTNEISEIAPDLAMVESFSHVAVWDVDSDLVCFDTSGAHTGADVVRSIRTWRPDNPFRTLVYTHGHADHVGGSGFFAADARTAGIEPTVIGHVNVANRLARYDVTAGWNVTINARQFGGLRGELNLQIGEADSGTSVQVRPGARRFLPASVLQPTLEVDDHAEITLASGATMDLFHDRGETDDHLWTWVPDKKWIFSGDFVIWNFPNAGNPQKVQRYPLDWARALRKMRALGPELLVPAHGLPISGADRIARVLDEIATALEMLHDEVLAMMNAGETLDHIVHSVRVPDDTLAKPYLRPFYDEPEFVIRNIWRLYGGWWDGAPARLKPAPDQHLAQVLTELSGGSLAMAERARRAAEDGDFRLACHLIDFAADADPENRTVHAIRSEIYLVRRKNETSLMAKGIFMGAARESQAVVDASRSTSPG
ncbi:MAG: alkyl sulfatase dimerization domain-containing protein [Actinomycetota bacterium]